MYFFTNFAKQLKIFPKDGDPVPFRLNPAQRIVEAAVLKQRRAGKPVRLRVLKYRQAGVSLYWTVRLLWEVIRKQGTTAMSIADKQDLPQQWLRRLKSLLAQMPSGDSLKALQLKASSANELYFDAMGCRYTIASAEGTTPGMGAVVQAVHASEVASWANPDKVFFDLIPAVPNSPNTIIVQESTGRSVGDWFYKRYNEAKRGEDEQGKCDYQHIFLNWPLQPEYRDNPKEILSLNKEEQLLRDIYKLDDAQMAWRRRMMRSEFHGDEAAFANQFPINETEAFLSGGLNRYTREQVAKARATIRPPVWRGEILPKANPQQFELLGVDAGMMLTWDHDPKKGEKPDNQRHYVIGADNQWGTRLGGPANREPDYDSCWVECVETRKICAHIYGRMQMGAWASKLAAMGHYYANRQDGPALLAPERNAKAGEGVIRPLLGQSANNWSYPNLYVRGKSRAFGIIDPVDYGWLMDHHSKQALLVHSYFMFDKPYGFDWPDEALVDELASIIQNDKGEIGAPEGSHDDKWVSRLITAFIAQEYREELMITQPGLFAAPLDSRQQRIEEYLEAEDARDKQRELEAQHGEW